METLALLKEVGFECTSLVTALKDEVAMMKSEGKKRRLIDLDVDAKLDSCASLVCLFYIYEIKMKCNSCCSS